MSNEMKEKPMSSKTTKPPSRDAAEGNRNDKAPQQRRTTRERIRKIIERHRETFDQLAK